MIRQELDVLRHLPWSARAAWAWYGVRRILVAPAPPSVRCIMGGPVAPSLHCPRRAVDGALLCRRHGGAS